MAKPCWDVYGLVDPASDYIFYIGIAQNVDKRLSQHRSGKDSSAYEAIQQLAEFGFTPADVKYVKFAHVHSKELAMRVEEHLIILCPHAVNKTHQGKAERFWSGLDHEFGAPWWRRVEEMKFHEAFGG